MEAITNILLLALLFVAGLVNFLLYFPTKRLSAWLQSLSPPKPAAAPPPPPPPPELRRVFRTFDKNNDGYITKNELIESLRNVRIPIAEREAEELFEAADGNGDGLIDFEEFCDLGEKLMDRERENNEDENEELREAFGVFDKDKDGMISVEELGLVLSCLGLKEGKRVENCKEMIRKVDLDGDGMVNFEEFKKMMRNGGN